MEPEARRLRVRTVDAAAAERDGNRLRCTRRECNGDGIRLRVAAAVERDGEREGDGRVAAIRQRQRDRPARGEKQGVVAIHRAVFRALPRTPVIRRQHDRFLVIPRRAVERQSAFETAGTQDASRACVARCKAVAVRAAFLVVDATCRVRTRCAERAARCAVVSFCAVRVVSGRRCFFARERVAHGLRLFARFRHGFRCRVFKCLREVLGSCVLAVGEHGKRAEGECEGEERDGSGAGRASERLPPARRRERVT